MIAVVVAGSDDGDQNDDYDNADDDSSD